MKTFKRILILTIGLFLASCTEEIIVDLDTAPPKLVVDAAIEWYKNTAGNEQKIILSTTTGYYSSEFPTVSGATIFISNSTNIIFTFVETTTDGQYECTNFIPVIGERYVLTIILNGQTYTATETLTKTPLIEEPIVQNDAGGFAGDEIEIKYQYQDDNAEENYYVNSVVNPHVLFPEYSVEDDELYNGNKIDMFYSNPDLVPGDVLKIKMFGTSKTYHSYFKQVILASGNDGNPFQTTPTSVRGNIINQTDASNNSLGYFRLSEVDTKEYTIQ